MKTIKISVMVLATFFIIFSALGNNKGNKKSAKIDITEKIELSGIVKSDLGKLANATVTLYIENDEIYSAETTENGKYKLMLSFNKDYTVEISKEGFISKRFNISTMVPRGKKILINQQFMFGVKLISEEEFKGLNTIILNFPVTHFYYDKKNKQFEYDKEYAKNMQEAYNRLLEKARQINELDL